MQNSYDNYYQLKHLRELNRSLLNARYTFDNRQVVNALKPLLKEAEDLLFLTPTDDLSNIADEVLTLLLALYLGFMRFDFTTFYEPCIKTSENKAIEVSFAKNINRWGKRARQMCEKFGQYMCDKKLLSYLSTYMQLQIEVNELATTLDIKRFRKYYRNNRKKIEKHPHLCLIVKEELLDKDIEDNIVLEFKSAMLEQVRKLSFACVGFEMFNFVTFLSKYDYYDEAYPFYIECLTNVKTYCIHEILVPTDFWLNLDRAMKYYEDSDISKFKNIIRCFSNADLLLYFNFSSEYQKFKDILLIAAAKYI
jgi:hypothetical protein